MPRVFKSSFSRNRKLKTTLNATHMLTIDHDRYICFLDKPSFCKSFMDDRLSGRFDRKIATSINNPIPFLLRRVTPKAIDSGTPSRREPNTIALPFVPLMDLKCFFLLWFLPPYLCCLLYTSPSPRDGLLCRMPSSA